MGTNGQFLSWRKVSYCVPQEFVLKPVQFNMSVNNLEREVNSKTNPLYWGY